MTDQRKSVRKVVKTRAALVVEGQGALHGRTADLCADGVSLTFEKPLPVGVTGQVMFEIFVDGKLTSISARSKAQYCIFSQGDYKVGFQFINLDLAGMTAVTRFLR